MGLRDFSNNKNFEKKVNNISLYNPYKHIGMKIYLYFFESIKFLQELGILCKYVIYMTWKSISLAFKVCENPSNICFEILLFWRNRHGMANLIKVVLEQVKGILSNC